ncbi:MAG: DNA mismatch repair protein MutT [Gammaproteobacteria bacterium RIFCSPHIGHO2_12_FULL_63_22]|nr:MAG: DNA mismatch repair protein MutT [Gammaproteobacteria bacterium RIFCSPHIGHO2_12_FULL_63_22]
MPRSAGLIHVVAGVLTDARGRILLARRTAGRDLAGAWEFPGGKVEPGETPFQALDRELHEELGIRIHSMEALIAVPQAYRDKRIVLEVFRISGFSGKPKGLENQALAWSPLEKLNTYPMPPADRPVVAALSQPSQYLITPANVGKPAEFLGRIEAALKAGMRRIQLRIEGLSDAETLALAAETKRLCDQGGAQLLVNADIELAVKLGCGVHLKSAQLMSLNARPLPLEQAVAASCHDEAQLRQAEALDVDFAVLGPVAKTPSHAEQPPMGWQRFAELRECVSFPIYALGGMHPSDHETARRHGAQGIAGIRGLWPS